MRNYFMMALMCVMMLAGGAFAQDPAFDSTGIEAALNGLKVPLYAIGGIILSVYVIPVLFRFVKSIIR